MELEVIAPRKTNDEWEEEGTKVWYIHVLPKEPSSLLLSIKQAVKLAPNRLPPSSPKLRPHVTDKVMLVGQFCQQWQHRFLYPQIPQSANKKPHSANQKTLVSLPLPITQLLQPTKTPFCYNTLFLSPWIHCLRKGWCISHPPLMKRRTPW